MESRGGIIGSAQTSGHYLTLLSCTSLHLTSPLHYSPHLLTSFYPISAFSLLLYRIRCGGFHPIMVGNLSKDNPGCSLATYPYSFLFVCQSICLRVCLIFLHLAVITLRFVYSLIIHFLYLCYVFVLMSCIWAVGVLEEAISAYSGSAPG